jgi:hypothetical protein
MLDCDSRYVRHVLLLSSIVLVLQYYLHVVQYVQVALPATRVLLQVLLLLLVGLL